MLYLFFIDEKQFFFSRIWLKLFYFVGHMLTWCVTPDTSSTWLLSGVSSGERHFEGHSAFSSSSCSISPRISSPVSSSRSATSFLITLTLACRRSLYYFHRHAHLNLYCTFFAPRARHIIYNTGTQRGA